MREALARRLWQKELSGCFWYADLYTVSDGRRDCCFSKLCFDDCGEPKSAGSTVEEVKHHVTAAVNYTAG